MHDLQIVEVPPGADIPSLIERYQQSGLVAFAEPDYRVRAAVTEPNDPRYLNGALWGLNNIGQSGGLVDADIDAPEAWDVRTSASNIVVAVVDTGVRATHEDLADNMWSHPVDGSHGWNALTGTNNPVDGNGHGTFVAGILGALGNNGLGVVGVAWDVQIMACKCLSDQGTGSISDLIVCLDFARTNGAQIVNASLIVPEASLALSNAVARLREDGIIMVASAGNDSADLDVTPVYPAAYGFDNIVSVGYSTRVDSPGGQSNYGATTVDLFAPGEAMHSTWWLANNSYLGGAFMVGSSFSAPYVSGSLALLRASYPWDTPQELVGRLLSGTDPVPAMAGKCVTGGRLNLKNALSPPIVLSAMPSAPGEPFSLRVQGGPHRVIVIQMTADFGVWTSLTIDTTGPEGWFDFLDPGSTNGQRRFYRAFADP
jgi:subtilisin family serine protease